MKYFLEMIAVAKKQGEIYSVSSKKEDSPDQVSMLHFFETIKKAQVLVFTPFNKEPGNADSFDENGNLITDIQLDAPFEVFSIEVLNSLITIPNPLEEVPIYTYCILAYEDSPSKFGYYAYVDFNGLKIVIHSKNHHHMYDGVVEKFIDRINSEKHGVEKVNKLTVLEGKNKKKYDYRIKKIIHIKPKTRNIETQLSEHQGREIEWRYRFFVRGHWRSLEEGQLGKNREGNYCVPGKTWVKESIKGPKDLPFLNKIRVVHGEKQ